jgi:hypothetical protein
MKRMIDSQQRVCGNIRELLTAGHDDRRITVRGIRMDRVRGCFLRSSSRRTQSPRNTRQDGDIPCSEQQQDCHCQGN